MKESYGHIRSQSTTPLLPYADQTPPASPFTSVFHGKRHMNVRGLVPRRRQAVLLLAVSAVVSLGFLSSLMVSHAPSSMVPDAISTAPRNETRQNASIINMDAPSTFEDSSKEDEYVLRPPPWVLGPPSESFRDNLRPDRKYITSWLAAGWNNDVMTLMNLIYLGKITDRIPILPAFTPSWHIGGDAPTIGFGEIFDIPSFIEDADLPVLEWSQVKDVESEFVDDVGCWNVWEAIQHNEPYPRGSDVPKWLRLDVSYTKAPEWIQSRPGDEHAKGASFWSLARLAYPEDRNPNLHNKVLASPEHGLTLEPDDHLLCFDYLYYVGAHQPLEYEYEYAPAWREIGTYLRWTETMEDLASQYLKRAFGIPQNHELPPYIAVHVRHGDFKEWCWEAENIDDCFAPIPVIARRVREVQAEILSRKGILIPMNRVVMTSDETDPQWWQEVTSLGWAGIDHASERTKERFGRWHPLILDSVIQSNSLGFVGTDRSTFSTLSSRRVIDWQDGSVRMVKWGKLGADDH